MFRTEIPFIAHPRPLPASARILTIGSCFSDTIGNRLTDAKVQALVNPFGTVFNPLSACKLLRAAVGEDMDWQQHLVEARGRWQSYDLHASIGADSPVALLQQIQELAQQTGEFLRTADVVIITLGSAFAYRLLETQELVSNCHKIPAERFEKELLTPDEIINAVAETHAFLRLQNPKLRFILTVSPVRHLKDTLPLNSVSKSVLRVACHYLSELLADVAYFPAYELLLDDLRDYRFYAADMLHPSDVAENYIWERFTRTYFDADFSRFQKEWESVKQALTHRPLYPTAPEHRQFLESTLARLQNLSSRVDLRAEIHEVEQRIKALPSVKIAAVPEPEEDDEERIDIGEGAERASLPVTIEVESVDEEEDEPETEATEEVVESSVLLAEEIAPLPAKKKRRSRGGAKRTARKKAAQLAALTAEETPLLLPPAELPVEESTDTSFESVETLVTEQDTPEAVASVPAEPEPIAPSVISETIELPLLAAPEEVYAEPIEPAANEEAAPVEPKTRKGRTAGQILKAKSGRKSAKASAASTAKTPKASPARSSRRKPTAEAPAPTEPQASPLPEPTSVILPEPIAEEVAPVASPEATKRRARPPRKRPTKPDESSSNS